MPLDQPDGLSFSSETCTLIPALSEAKRNVLKPVASITLVYSTGICQRDTYPGVMSHLHKTRGVGTELRKPRDLGAVWLQAVTELWPQQQPGSAWATGGWWKGGSSSSPESLCWPEVEGVCAENGLAQKYRKGVHAEFPNLHQKNLFSLLPTLVWVKLDTVALAQGRRGWVTTQLLQALFILGRPIAPTALCPRCGATSPADCARGGWAWAGAFKGFFLSPM